MAVIRWRSIKIEVFAPKRAHRTFAKMLRNWTEWTRGIFTGNRTEVEVYGFREDLEIRAIPRQGIGDDKRRGWRLKQGIQFLLTPEEPRDFFDTDNA
jgi:hypothetical protein